MQYGQCGICGFNNSSGIIRNDKLYACKSDRFSCWKAIVLLKPKKVKCECGIYNRKIIYIRTIEDKEMLLLQPLCSRCYISCKGQCQTKDCKLDRDWISPTEQEHQFVSFHGGKLLKYCSSQCTLQEKPDIPKNKQVYDSTSRFATFTSKERIIRKKEFPWNKPWKKQLSSTNICNKSSISQKLLEELHSRIRQLEQDKTRLSKLIRELQQDNARVRDINRAFAHK